MQNEKPEREKMKTHFPEMIRIVQKFENTVLENFPAAMVSQINHWGFENAVQRRDPGPLLPGL